MNKELALRTLAYLKTHYNNNDETTICKEDINAIDFILEDNEKLTDLINKYEDIGYDAAQERADFLLETERLNNIINELEKYCNEEIKDYDKALNNKVFVLTEKGKESYEAEKMCFLDMLERIQELKGSESNE